MTSLLSDAPMNAAANAVDHAADARLHTITHCEVCGGTSLTPGLELGRHAMCDDLIAVGDARECRKYPITIVHCAGCQTAHQLFQIPKHELFPTSYHYRARLTGDVLRGMADLVQSVEHHRGSVAGLRVLDIGCNDGSLLSIFRERGALTHGIEPTDAAHDARAAGHDVTQAYFDAESAAAFVAAHGPPDLITFTNVFAHIERLDLVIDALRPLLGPSTQLVIENHYFGAVLDRDQFDTFYHEHPRTYSATSFAHIATRLGCAIQQLEFPSRYGGNIRVMMAPIGDATAASVTLPDESGFGVALQAMGARVDAWRSQMRQEIDALVAVHGPLRAKAFPGRAAILVELLGLDTTDIAAVYEQPGSPKIGHYVPGTRIPIVSDADFAVTDSAPVLNLAWHIAAEIERYLRSTGFVGPIIPVLSVAPRTEAPRTVAPR